MKWFQHQSNSHHNLKFQPLIEEFGWESYALYWVLCELVASQGTKIYTLSAQKNWKKYLISLFKKHFQNDSELECILQKMAEVNLISKKWLNKGTLAIPKMRDYAGNWQRRPQSNYRDTTEQLQIKKKIEENRIEEKRREEKRKEGNSPPPKNKPYFRGMEMRKKDGKLWVIPKEGGKWLEFDGDSKDITYK